MPRLESDYELLPHFAEVTRIAPNERVFPKGTLVNILTTDHHFLEFEILPKGPSQDDHLMTLIRSEPPIYENAPHEKEVYVDDDILAKDRDFRLSSALPVLTQTVFRVLALEANISNKDIPAHDVLVSDLRTSVSEQ